MTQPQSASVNLSAIGTPVVAGRSTMALRIDNNPIVVLGSELKWTSGPATWGLPGEAEKKAWDDAVKGYLRMYEPGGALSRKEPPDFDEDSGDELIKLNEPVKHSDGFLAAERLTHGDWAAMAGLSSGVAISSRMEIISELAKPGAIGPDLDDDYSDFLDNDDDCEDDDE